MNDSEADREVTPAWIVAAILLLAALGGAIALGTWPLGGSGAGEPTEPRLIEPVDDGTLLWPYTAKSKRHGARTLAVSPVTRRRSTRAPPADVAPPRRSHGQRTAATISSSGSSGGASAHG